MEKSTNKSKRTDSITISADHITNKQSWMRLVYMILFGIVLYVMANAVVLVLAIVQFIFVLATGRPNGHLESFCASTSHYCHQVIRYLTYTSEDRPFPFDQWPQG